MLFQELVETLGADNPEEVRAFMTEAEIPVNPKARIIPDQYVDQIIEGYKKHKKSAPKADEAEISAPVVESKHEAARIIRSAPRDEDDMSSEDTVEAKEGVSENTLSKFKTAKNEEKKEKKRKKKHEHVLVQHSENTLKRDISNIRTDDFELDLEDDATEVSDDHNDDDAITAEVERIEKEQERERMRANKTRKVHTEPAAQLDDEEVAKREAQRKGENLIQKNAATIPEVITVKEFAEKIGVVASKVIKELLKNGIIVTINHKIDFDTAALIGEEFGIKIEKEMAEISTSDLMQGNLAAILEHEDKEELEDRPPIVSIMGHVDHGKTSLLDYIRKSKITASEAGGITQQIGAYQVDVKGKRITFLDTPGHEAFTAMRARGAKATDIAILVVAADEGVKPQTIEAINHAKEAGIPIIVAINKIDKEGANPDKVKGELAEHNIVSEDWGGDTVMAPISAMSGEGIDNLLDMILLVAEMGELLARKDRDALGTVIESHLDTSLGPVATVLINTGTLKQADNFVVGEAYGRVKLMQNSKLKKIAEAGPSMPVRIIGFSETPQVGDILQVVPTEKEARDKAMAVKALRNSAAYKAGTGASLNDIIAKIGMGELKQLKVVLKADTKGTLEAVRASVQKLNTEEVEVVIIHSGVGNITETDVLMASASQGLVLGFAVEAPAQVVRTAEKMNVSIKTYRVIYHLTDEIKKLLSGLLDPLEKEVQLGDFEVIQTFFTSKKFMIIGGKVIKGKLESKAKVRVVRGDKMVAEGLIDSLQKGQETVKEISEGHECGIKFIGKYLPEPGDILEVYKIERIERSL